MRSKLVRNIGLAALMGGGLFAMAPPASASALVTQTYTCSAGGAQTITIVGTAKQTETSETISLTGVKFTFKNSFSFPVTADSLSVTVPDPNNTSAPYIAGSVGVATSPAGWTASHGTGGINAFHAGSFTLAAGASISNAALKAKYKDMGPTGTVINWVGGTVSLHVTSPAVLTVTCTPSAPLLTFATNTE